MSINVAWFPDYGHLMAGIFRQYSASIRGSVISHYVILHGCLQDNQGTSGFPIHFLVRGRGNSIFVIHGYLKTDIQLKDISKHSMSKNIP